MHDRSNPYSRESMSERFWALTDQRAAIHKVSKPVREERDALLAQIRPLEAKEREIIKRYKELERDLPSIDGELSRLSRALGGKVNPRG